jgi:hypothetical protein
MILGLLPSFGVKYIFEKSHVQKEGKSFWIFPLLNNSKIDDWWPFGAA